MASYGYAGSGRHGQWNTDGYNSTGDYVRRASYSEADDYYNNGGCGGRPAAGGYGSRTAYSAEYAGEGDYERYRKEEKEHKHKERMGEVGALAAGAFALYEGNKAKKDPAHEQRHRIEQGVAAATALGAGGYAFHEHRREEAAEDEAKDYKKHHYRY